MFFYGKNRHGNGLALGLEFYSVAAYQGAKVAIKELCLNICICKLNYMHFFMKVSRHMIDFMEEPSLLCVSFFFNYG